MDNDPNNYMLNCSYFRIMAMKSSAQSPARNKSLFRLGCILALITFSLVVAFRMWFVRYVTEVHISSAGQFEEKFPSLAGLLPDVCENLVVRTRIYHGIHEITFSADFAQINAWSDRHNLELISLGPMAVPTVRGDLQFQDAVHSTSRSMDEQTQKDFHGFKNLSQVELWYDRKSQCGFFTVYTRHLPGP